jgi:hypothetical protein
MSIKTGKICPYCLNETEYVDSKEVYGKSFGMIYLCRPCSSYVGVHKGTDKALGRLANADLRKAKMEAHFWFDKIAKTNVINEVWPVYFKNTSNRSKSYLWLSKHMGLDIDDCHIGMFDIDNCARVVEISKKALENHKYGMPTRPPEIDNEFFKK